VSRGAPLPRGVASRLGVACATLLVVLLPTVLAARHAADPARGDELARIARALAPDDAGLETGVARGYLAAAAGTDALPAADADRQAVVVRARVRQLACLLLTTACVYAAVAMARGRLQALLACLLFAALPSVQGAGAWLRPEGPAAAAAAMATVLLLQVAHQPRTATWLTRRTQGVLLAASALCGVAAQALAVALLPTLGAALLLPGGLLAVLAVQLALRARRIVRRGGWLRWPVRAINRRLLPWTALSFLAPAVALWGLSHTLRGPAEAALPSASDLGLLPAGVAGWPLAGLLALGVAAMVVHVGATFRRSGRASAELALAVACAATFASYLRAPSGVDLLPMALPTAVLLAEGAQAALLLGRRALGASPRAVTSP